MKLSQFVQRIALTAALAASALAFPAQAEKLRVGYWPSGLTLGYGAVLEAGDYFKDQGLDVEYVRFSDVNGPTRGLAANAIDLAFGSPAAGAFASGVEGVPVKVILATQPANVVFVVPEDSPIKTLSDFKGKKVGMSPAGSSTATIASAILAGNYGIKEGEFALVGGNESRLVQFLAQKEVDAAALRNVTVEQIKDLKIRKLGTFGDEWKKLTKGDSIPYNAVGVVRDDYLKKNPEAVVRAIVAMRNALEWGQKHPAEVVEIVQKAGNLPQADAQVFADLWNENYRVSFNAEDQATLKRQIDIFRANGTLKSTPPADLFDPVPDEQSLKQK